MTTLEKKNTNAFAGAEAPAANYTYVKVLLYSYPKLEALIDAVSVSVTNKAVLSYKSTLKTETLLEKIEEDILLRQALLELNELMKGILATLSEEENYLLEYKYFRRKKVLLGRYANFSLCCSERNYFRKQQALLRKLGALLLKNGWTDEQFRSSTGTLFSRLFRAVEGGRELSVAGKRRFGRVSLQNSGCSSGTGGFLPRRTSTAMATAATQATQMTTISTADNPPEVLLASPPDALCAARKSR